MTETGGSRDETTAAQFWEFVCTFTLVLRFLLAVFLTLLVATLVAYPFLEPGTESHVIAVVNVGFLAPSALLAAYFIRKCRSGAGRASE